ncbi:hypothetical protein HMPREF9093_00503 [Fusobacterium sp. oral taxon 370 str. F0437]|uniref:DEAD/DEAH box helicase n=1 Tax=Fusobacterium sp. oral taxon 370 TaxID=712288 RepID=UPI000234AC8B|nr:AAA family ATPase [Fusobacterium sp. oral taxon 370]EHI79247.1 hypothetical protein HMPREF9093_00503 [Fusobacterium sp. oral taxon 370 str. F0437]
MNNMNKDFFYSNLDKNFLSKDKEEFLDNLKKYSETNKKQIYILEKPLLGKENYFYKEATAVFIPKHKIYFFNFNIEKEEDFEDYIADYIEDIGYISDKYGYKEEIGRPRIWKEQFIEKLNYSKANLEKILSNEEILKDEDIRKVDLLTSLAIGSINDIIRVKGKVEDLLEKIKKRIILFDSDQTRFIYEDIPDKKVVRIQGLAGTGKTELLLHKLKELYLKDNSTKIVITCHNKVLKESLEKRIPDFFNFMKVEEQIKWNERLWCISSWGKKIDRNSGLYSFITHFYDINFYPFSNSKGYNFKEICQKAIEELELKNIEPYFDYILIDESQDFSEEFINLCDMITKKKIYVAGDIFQSIFNIESLKNVNDANFLLNKCYRTDPKTLMFAHSLGMGLFEKNKISWLNEEGWEACGYEVQKDENNYILTRSPLRRFEDLDLENENTVEIFSLKKDNDKQEYAVKIFEIIEEIAQKFSTVSPNDIAVIFLEDTRYNYELMDIVAHLIDKLLNWKTNKGYETKKKIENTVFISNKNNIKGLEFPFIICVSTDIISSNLIDRNALYMIITRSFLKTYFLFSDRNTDEFKESLNLGLESINRGEIKIEIPTDEQQKEIKNNIRMLQQSSKKSLLQKMEEEIKKQKVEEKFINKLKKQLLEKIENDGDEFDDRKLPELVKKAYEFIKM